jgi:preprotein translocase SecE subunit
MAMAVAMKTSPETSARDPLSRLALGSVAGTAYVLAGLAVVFYGIPTVWDLWISPWLTGALNPFVDGALKLLVMLAAFAGFVVGGLRLAGPHPVHGVRAGTFCGIVTVLVAALLTQWVGLLLEIGVYQHHWFGPAGWSVGVGLTAAVGIGLLVLGFRLFFRPKFENWLMRVEDQGWFSSAGYKRSQGLRVRRGTILGILLLAGCGIYTLLSHGTLNTASRDWRAVVPFTAVVGAEGQDGAGQVIGHTRHLIILPHVQYTVPLLLTLASLWLAYRVVNFPTFADFLIATEAEVNKVSWTTRKRLKQDTIVVLMTVILLTAFLFVVDQLWATILTRVGVLQIPTSSQGVDAAKEQPW